MTSRIIDGRECNPRTQYGSNWKFYELVELYQKRFPELRVPKLMRDLCNDLASKTLETRPAHYPKKWFHNTNYDTPFMKNKRDRQNAEFEIKRTKQFKQSLSTFHTDQSARQSNRSYLAPKCTAIKRSGKKCTNPVVENGLCGVHRKRKYETKARLSRWGHSHEKSWSISPNGSRPEFIVPSAERRKLINSLRTRIPHKSLSPKRKRVSHLSKNRST